MRIKTQLQTGIDLADRVKTILGLKDWTLHRVSQRSLVLYGNRSHYFIPHGFYRDLRLGKFSPSLHQLCALSHISGYELLDWLRVFGFDLNGVLRLQASLPFKRTRFLDPSLDNRNAWIPWFQDAAGGPIPVGIAPLGRLIKPSQPRRLRSLSEANTRGFMYVKIGREDALAFPDLLPGSIVRVNPEISEGLLSEEDGRALGRIFLIEHSKGLCCCRLRWQGKNRIIPLSSHLPYAYIELHIPSEARILGVVDMEIRRLSDTEQPAVLGDPTRGWRSERWDQQERGLGGLLRRARRRAALSFREASAMSRRIADFLGDERYFAAAGSLSDYEARDTPPRHIHKVLTLCLLYGVQFSEFLNAAGIAMEELGANEIPAGFISGPERAGTGGTTEIQIRNPTLDSLLARFVALPFFLRKYLEPLSGMKKLSLRDFFWVGAEFEAFHPYLKDGLLLIVNRRKKRVIHLRPLPLWRQPLYVLETRTGGYLCACCSLEDGVLVAHPYLTDFQPSLQFRNRDDAEVVGQVVAIARRLG